MRVIEVALRHSTLGYEIPLSISSLLLRREYGSVQKRAVEKRRNQTTNLGVRSFESLRARQSFQGFIRNSPWRLDRTSEAG
jgi:hypothetical protein